MVEEQTMRRTLSIALAFVVIELAQPPLARAYCTGDCDANGTTSTAEYVNCRGIFFGSRPLSECPRCDCDENGTVSQAELTQAEQNAAGSCNVSECPMATGTPQSTATATSTATPTSAIPTRTRTPTEPPSSPSSTPSTDATATPVPGACVGDCDDSGAVVVNEVVVGVNITLERAEVSSCPSFDANATTTGSIDELVRGVNHLLRGCP
jgi:hypothetical protein